MTGRELSAEMATAASSVRLGHLERLRGLGVPYPALATLNAVQPTIGVARIKPGAGGLFDYDEGGLPACLVAVVDVDPELGDAGIFDIVAFAADNPARWWGRTGWAFGFGDHWLELGEPVRVVSTPVQWLAAGGNAFCLLDWSPESAAWSALRACPPLQFTDDVLRVKMRNAIVQAAPVPQMELLPCAA